VRQFVKGLLGAVAPRWTTALLSARARAHSQRVIAGWGNGPAARKLIEHLGSHVQAGPFQGLILTEMTHAEQLGPYLLGLYECELDEAWNTVFRRTFTQVIDIGAKFGYYAVGLARRYPLASVVAFDTDWWARKAVRQMAAANGAGNVEVRGFCSPEWLASNAREGAFIISDCEGYEAALFQPEIIARLRSATLIIETHDVFVPGVTKRLRSAFSETHTVRVFGHGITRRSASCALDFLSEPERRLSLQEVRSDQLWMLCLPRTDPVAAARA
jgi:hypothetical protein